MFSERVIHPPVEPRIVSAADALAVTLHEVGHVDLARIGELLGRTLEQVLAELGEAVFLDPARITDAQDVWIAADEALSGAVRSKLAAAEAGVARDVRFRRNVEALRRVQPEDLRPSDITARLGAPWIPAEDVAAFAGEVSGVACQVFHCAEVACWSLDKALNSATPQIFDVIREDDRERRERNAQETEAAEEKLARIKSAFERWVWTDSARSDRRPQFQLRPPAGPSQTQPAARRLVASSIRRM